MSETLLVAGTASHVGKSTVATGLCRLLADRGVDVAPFKGQNMSNNARAVPRPGDGPAFGEVGVSQYVQARAARVPARTDHNPVLLKPRGDGESQLLLDGRPVGHYPAREYYDEHWEEALATLRRAHDRLAADHEVIVAEGAGSIAEINLRDRDLANVETARHADARILLVADVERGGVFAALVGTLELLPADLRERVAGAVITKFRGDRALIAPGVEAFEERTGVPVLGVLPYDDPGLPEEDSVALPARDETGETAVRGADDGVPEECSVTVAVPRLPRISNATDLAPLAREPGVRVAYRPLDAPLSADAVVIPGTKNTVDDLLAVREAGLDERLRAFDGPVVGLCGGYQLLGEAITGADHEGVGDRDRIAGVGLLPVRTRFSPTKTITPVERDLRGVGPLAGVAGTVSGYEIHAGETTAVGEVDEPFPDAGAAAGAASGAVLGTYLHGLFDDRAVRAAFLDAVAAAAGVERPGVGSGDGSPGAREHDGAGARRDLDAACDRGADLLGEHADLGPLGF